MTKERPRLGLADATAAPRTPLQALQEVEEPIEAARPPGLPERAKRRRAKPGEPRAITFWVLPDVFKILKQIAMDENLTMRELMTKMVADYLRRKKQISIVNSPPPRG